MTAEHPALRAMREIAEFAAKASQLINVSQIDRMAEVLVDLYHRKGKVLVMGAGRSGLVGKAFAMRLLHLGFNSYVLGETIVPSIYLTKPLNSNGFAG